MLILCLLTCFLPRKNNTPTPLSKTVAPGMSSLNDINRMYENNYVSTIALLVDCELLGLNMYLSMLILIHMYGIFFK